jgi:hypothetical protein
MSVEKIKIREDIRFNKLDNYAEIPKGHIFNVEYWQGINGENCPVVDGSPFVDSIIYFKGDEYMPL